MTVIKQDDLIQSVADALQFISYYHPVDFIQAMHEAYLREESPAARDSMAQILINSRMCATGHRPICQDTGIVTVFVRVGMDVRWDGATMSLDDMINEGVRRAYNLPENVLRASILADPAGSRKNTKDNTPAVIHYSIVPGDKVEVDVAAKGGGSENKSEWRCARSGRPACPGTPHARGGRPSAAPGTAPSSRSLRHSRRPASGCSSLPLDRPLFQIGSCAPVQGGHRLISRRG
ncbi:hypothetical protein SSTU70S_06872 [Stutzerimonas stutzeri]